MQRIAAGKLDAVAVFGRAGTIREVGHIDLRFVVDGVRGWHAVAGMSREFPGKSPAAGTATLCQRGHNKCETLMSVGGS
jgi:hypothetical protein